jgi:hypothetical protein
MSEPIHSPSYFFVPSPAYFGPYQAAATPQTTYLANTSFYQLKCCGRLQKIVQSAMQSIGNPQQQLHICTSPAVLYITQMSLADTYTFGQFLLTELTGTAHKADIPADILQAFFIVHLDTSIPGLLKILCYHSFIFLKGRFHLLKHQKHLLK